MAVTVFVGHMATDYATGIMSGDMDQNLKSRVGFNGTIHKIYNLMLVGSVYLLALIVPGIEYVRGVATISFYVLEFISTIKNGTKMELPTPNFIKNILAIVKDKTGEEGTR